MKSFTTLPLSDKVKEWQESYKLCEDDSFMLMSAEYELNRFKNSRFGASSSLTNFRRDTKRFEDEIKDLIVGDWELNLPLYPTEVYKSLLDRIKNLESLSALDE